MSTFERPWFLCGGWAVDSWLGRQTRDHGDLDIVVFHEDQRTLHKHLAGWNVVADAPNDTTPAAERPPWDGQPMDPDHRWRWPETPPHIHARPNAEQAAEPGAPRELEVMIIERSGPDWLLYVQPRLARPVSLCVRPSIGGIAAVVPEVLMLYKATAYWGDPKYPRSHDESDFFALAAMLGEAERAWLAEATSQFVPNHPWLPRLTAE
jgi:hypothetical protein